MNMSEKARFVCDEVEAEKANNLAVELYRQIAKFSSKNDNFVICPQLILQNILQLYHLSNGDPKIKAELDVFLVKFDLEGIFKKVVQDFQAAISGQDPYEFHAASALFNPSASNKLNVENLQFLDGKEQNAFAKFVSEVSKEHVSGVPEPPIFAAGNANNYFLSVAHFFSDWENKFLAKLTNIFEGRDRTPTRSLPATLEDFHNADKTISQVIMAHLQEKIFLTHDENLKATILELPLAQYEMSMALIVPDENDLEALENVEKKMTGQTLALLRKDWQMPLTHVYLPKFSLQKSVSLNKPLEHLGLKHLFKADLHVDHLVNFGISATYAKLIQSYVDLI